MTPRLTILVHHIFYRPEPIGNGTYSGEMCEWLAKQGHSVRVVCPPPYYPFWKVQPPYTPWTYRCEVIADVAVSRCPIWVPAKPRGVKRLLYAASFAISSFPVMVREIFRRPDVILVIEPSFLNAITSLLFAKCCGALAWLHVQDFELDLAFDLQQFRSLRLRSFVRAIESWVMRRFDTVSTISGRMLERVREKGVTEQRCVLFPNWVDTSSIYPLPESNGDKIVALYSGTTGAKQGLDLLIDAARLIQDHAHIEIVICGDGTAGLQKCAKDLPNVRFLPLQPLESLNELLSTADIHLLPQKPSVADLVMPSKLLGMVASGRPIVATAEEGTEVAKVVSRCGIVVPPECPAALARAIVQLADDPERRRELGRRARDFAVGSCEKETIIAAFERELLSRLQLANPIPQEAS
jgi:colanic acid biosynthesis glycosyl transferase WcaI